MSELRTTRGNHTWAYAALGLAVLWSHWTLRVYAMDDAYIHIRIADHLAQNGRPYYHLDEPLKASSSSVWTLLEAGVFTLFGATPDAVAPLNALILGLTCVVWVAAVRGITGRRDFATDFGTTLIVVSACFVSSVGLMESPLAMLLLGAALWQYQKGRAFAFVLLGLAVFVRLEAAVYLLVLWLANLAERRVHPAKAAAAALLGAAPLLVYDLAFFGTVIPGTMAAKQQVYQLSLGDFLSVVANSLLIGKDGTPPRWLVITWTLGLVGGTAACLLRRDPVENRAPAQDRRLLIGLGAMGGIVLTGYAVKCVLVFPWYMPLFSLPLFIFLFAAARLTGRRAIMVLFGIAWIPTGVSLAQNCLAAATARTLYSESTTCARVRKYLELGAELRQSHPDARLMTSEIGGLGYAFGGRILDAGGLVSPEVLRYHPLAVPHQRPHGMTGAIPTQYIRDERPDLIVSLDAFLLDFFDSDLVGEYELRKEPIYLEEDRPFLFNRQLWGSTYMAVLTRKQP